MSNIEDEEYEEYGPEDYEDDDSDQDYEGYDEDEDDPEYPEGDEDVYVDPCDEFFRTALSGCSHDKFFDAEMPRLQNSKFKESRLCCNHHHGYIYQNQCKVGESFFYTFKITL